MDLTNQRPKPEGPFTRLPLDVLSVIVDFMNSCTLRSFMYTCNDLCQVLAEDRKNQKRARATIDSQLVQAIKSRNAVRVKALLAKDANPGHRDLLSGCTMLYLAVSSSPPAGVVTAQSDIVDLLVEAGCDPNIPSTPRQYTYR